MIVSDTALEIMREMVLRPDESPSQMVHRVADFVANGDEELFHDFVWVMKNKYFIPNSPCLANAKSLNQLMACFVLPVDDTMESIMGTLYNASMIQKTGGGVGFNFSHVRPEGSLVKSTNGIASGPVSFIRMYNGVMQEIRQGGRRKGASLATLDVNHDDIEKFIQSKYKDGDLNNFNISVAVDDGFMDLVKGEFEPAVRVWDMIVESAWATADPGLLFTDTINKYNPLPGTWIESTNPCGESVLLPYESCVLGSLNLPAIHRDSDSYEQSQILNHGDCKKGLLQRVVEIAVTFLDNVIDVSEFPLPEIEKATKHSRKIGLGIMGLADLLYMERVRYGSDRSLLYVSSLMSEINAYAFTQSHRLGLERGSYPAWKEENGHILRRNACVMSIAPTGTLASIGGCTFSAEPEFALVFRRKILEGREFYEVNPIFKAWLEEAGLYSEELLDKIEGNGGSVQGMKEIPKDIQKVFVVSPDLTYKEHIMMQATLQRHVDQSISKTINLPRTATKDDISNAYMMAWKEGCKGITVYRDGSKENQVISVKHKPTERPDILYGKTRKFKSECGSLYVTVNRDILDEPHEVFANHSKRSGCVVALLNALASVTSISLRSGVDPSALAATLKRQECGSCEGVGSCAGALGLTIEPEEQSCAVGGECKTCG